MVDDPTVCNECVCAFCKDEAQIVDLCSLHASAPALNKQLVNALERARPTSPIGTVRSAIDRALAAAKEMEE